MSADAWPEPIRRIGELRVASLGEIVVSWDYLEAGTHHSDEREILAIIRHHISALRNRVEGTAASLILTVQRIPTDRGPVGPPGFSFTRRDAENNLERPRSVDELLRAAEQHLFNASD